MTRQSRPAFAGDSPGTNVTLGGNQRVIAEEHGGTGKTAFNDAIKDTLSNDLEILRRASGGALEGISFEDLVKEELTTDGDLLIRNGTSIERLAGPTAPQLSVPLLYDSNESPKIGWGDRWATGRRRRRRMEVLGNANRTTLTNVGFPGSITQSGTASSEDRTTMPFVRHTSGASIGDFAGVETEFDIVRWKWNPTVTFHFRTQNANNATIWVAATDTTLDGVTTPSTQQMAGLKSDPAVDGNWHTWTCDGTSTEDQDTGISVLGAKVFVLWLEIDTANSEVRFYLYNWSDATYHGLISTHSTTYPGVLNADSFGCGVSIEATSATARDIDFSRLMVEHDG